MNTDVDVTKCCRITIQHSDNKILCIRITTPVFIGERIIFKISSSGTLWTSSRNLVQVGTHFAASAYCPLSILTEKPLRITISKAAEMGVEEGQLELVNSYFEIPVHQEVVLQPNYHALISLEEICYPRTFLVCLTGTISNLGTKVWQQERYEPVRLGVVIADAHDLSKKPVFEFRHDIIGTELSPGFSLPFRFNFSTLDFSPGKYAVYLCLVKEGAFWFSQAGSPGTSVIIDVEPFKTANRDDTDTTYLLNPAYAFPKQIQEAKIVFIVSELPLYDRSGGGKRIDQILTCFAKKGVKVSLVYERRGVGNVDSYVSRYATLGITVSDEPLMYLSTHKENITLCVIGWYECAARLFSAVKLLVPDAKVVVDSVDIHWLRSERDNTAHLPTVAEEKKKEISVYSKADEVWVVSEQDQNALRAELPNIKTKIVGLPSVADPLPQSGPKKDRALFVGSFSHPPNEKAAVWAAEIVSKFNATSTSQLGLDIIGSSPPPSVRSLHDGSVIVVHDHVENIKDFFSDSKVLLAPLTFGAGIKIKICDAILEGLPIITTLIGIEGLPLKANESVLIAKTTDEFVHVLGQLVKGEVNELSLTRAAFLAFMRRHSESALTSILLSSCVAPRIVIAIVTYNARDMVVKCIKSILENTKYPNYTIAVVSNGCTDDTCSALSMIQKETTTPIDVHRKEFNDFFVKPSNSIISHYPDCDVVLMNNDVEVINSGWLMNLMDTAYSDVDVAAAGGKLLDKNGLVSEAGAEMYSSGFGRNLGKGLNPDHAYVCMFRSVGFVSGCLLYLRRDAITQVGLLDEDFHPMYFEDVAWNYLAHQKGLKTIYTPWAVAVHAEGSTAGTDISIGMKKYQEINRLKFLKKFKGVEIEKYN